MLTFKIGQKILIKSHSWFNCVKDIRTCWIKRFGECFTSDMAEKLCGKMFEVKNIIDDKFYVIDSNKLIFEEAVDIIESAKENNINIPVIEKGKYPGYSKDDERTEHEVINLIIFKINHKLGSDATPCTVLPTTQIEKEQPAKTNENDNVVVKKKRGRPKGTQQIKNIQKRIIENKVKLEKGELVICWSSPSRTDFCLGIYQSTKGKLIEVIVGGELKTFMGVMKYTKDNFDKLTSETVSYLRNIDKDLNVLNENIKQQIKEFEEKYNVKLSKFDEFSIQK